MSKITTLFTKRTILIVTLLLASSTLLSACLPINKSQPAPNNNNPAKETTSEKSGFSTLTGTLQTTSASAGILQTATGPIGVESYAVTLSEYQGQKVTVTGKYSGDTLFVSEITPAE